MNRFTSGFPKRTKSKTSNIIHVKRETLEFNAHQIESNAAKPNTSIWCAHQIRDKFTVSTNSANILRLLAGVLSETFQSVILKQLLKQALQYILKLKYLLKII